jgi:hypothetical protein
MKDIIIKNNDSLRHSTIYLSKVLTKNFIKLFTVLSKIPYCFHFYPGPIFASKDERLKGYTLVYLGVNPVDNFESLTLSQL